MSLEKLLDIRTKRKERVFLELSIASDNVAVKERGLQESKDTLKAYHSWRITKQKSLFDDLTSQQFKPKEYEKYLAKLTKIDVQERQYTEQLETAESVLEEAKKDYQNIKVKSLAVTRKLEKLTEILKGTEESAKIISLRKEEREAEDFVPMRKY